MSVCVRVCEWSLWVCVCIFMCLCACVCVCVRARMCRLHAFVSEIMCGCV